MTVRQFSAALPLALLLLLALVAVPAHADQVCAESYPVQCYDAPEPGAASLAPDTPVSSDGGVVSSDGSVVDGSPGTSGGGVAGSPGVVEPDAGQPAPEQPAAVTPVRPEDMPLTMEAPADAEHIPTIVVLDIIALVDAALDLG